MLFSAHLKTLHHSSQTCHVNSYRLNKRVEHLGWQQRSPDLSDSPSDATTAPIYINLPWYSPVPSALRYSELEPWLCKSPCVCMSQRTDQQIYSAIKHWALCYSSIMGSFTEARASHWLTDKKWTKHLFRSAGWGRQFAWIPHISDNTVIPTTQDWLCCSQYCLYCLCAHMVFTIRLNVV